MLNTIQVAQILDAPDSTLMELSYDSEVRNERKNIRDLRKALSSTYGTIEALLRAKSHWLGNQISLKNIEGC